MSLISDRQQLTDLLVQEARACGLPNLTVGRQRANGAWAPWSYTVGDTSHTYRAVLPSQIVFDIGDHAPWEKIRWATHRLWTILNRWGIAYWGSLSGGKGTHTEFFIRPTPEIGYDDGWRKHGIRPGTDLRPIIADWIVRQMMDLEPVKRQIMVKDPYDHFDIDTGHIAPMPQMKLLRDFGCLKPSMGTRKTLWTTGPAPFPWLPTTRNEAYKYNRVLVPLSLPVNDDVPGASQHERASSIHGPCPQGPQCLPGPQSECGADGSCAHCPVTGDMGWLLEHQHPVQVREP